MYTFVRALVVEYGANKKFEWVDINDLPCNMLLDKYRKVYLVLKHTNIDDEMTLDADDIVSRLNIYDDTISGFLINNGNATLPTKPGIPHVVNKNVVFSDAFRAGFHVDTIDPNVGEGVYVDKDDRNDLIIKPSNQGDRQNYDYISFRNRVLASVNGFYHRTGADHRGYYVLDGAKSARISKKNHVGLLSFGSIGELEYIDITDDNLVLDIEETSQNVDRAHIRFEEGKLDGKTPILILGGYMLLVDNHHVFSISPDTITFKLNRYPLMERYYESKEHIDFSGFDLEHTPNNPEWIEYIKLKKEEFIRPYLKMSQSFVVLVPTDKLLVDRIYLDRENTPHTYLSYDTPKYPLVVSEGKHEVYWASEDCGVWCIRCRDSYAYNRTVSTTAESDRLGIDDKVWMGRPGRNSAAFFLKMFTEDVVINE